MKKQILYLTIIMAVANHQFVHPAFEEYEDITVQPVYSMEMAPMVEDAPISEDKDPFAKNENIEQQQPAESSQPAYLEEEQIFTYQPVLNEAGEIASDESEIVATPEEEIVVEEESE